ncbi:uncharacterized protein LOC127874505 isoform X2 [Dreissena polymorpha]|nr:uncharacterized protein LOC127874505 isoform X2 [Dreissena polymorpha]
MGINVVAENTNYITSTIDAESRITEIREGSTAIDYTYTSSVTEYFVASNTPVTDLNGNELPGVMDQIALSNRELIVIFTAAGSAVLIAVCASICTYWKLKTGLRAVNNQVTENDNTTGQHNAIDANILQIPLQDSTYVHYHEISEVSIVNINPCDNLNNEINIADRHDGHLSTPTMEMLHMTEDDPSTSFAGKPLQNYPVPILFMALADTTFSDVDEPGFGNLKSRTDVESARYEYLNPETRDMKSQYNSLV